MKHKIIITLCLLFAAFISSAQTKNEYPRPQFERSEWVNLNGEWDYTLDLSNSGLERGFEKAKSFDGKILVPFCPESKLSGVEYTDFINCIWYHKEIEIPANWTSKMIKLNFEAVYYQAEVFVNEQFAGRHIGGSSSFCLDITKLITPGEKAHIVVRACSDLRSKTQSAGKQSLQYASHSCDYTRTTGIWQTVWMEAIDNQGLQSANILTDIDDSKIVINPKFYSENNNSLLVEIYDGGKKIASKNSKATNSSPIVIPIKKAKLWSPESPNLYDVVYKVVNKDGVVIDEIKSYFGMRKIHIEGNKIYLNNQPYYQRLVLDQGYYPDGLWTAPSDEALKRDIELSKAIGFNGARLHQKVFEQRYYYWADKIGYLTWGEAPSWGMDANLIESARNFLAEWAEIVTRDINHPSLVVWTPMNEEFWPENVQYPRFVEDLYDLTKALDPSRPVNDVSGGVHIKTDIWTVHHYEQDPDKLQKILYNEGKFFQTPIYPIGLRAQNVGYNNTLLTEKYTFPLYDGTMPYFVDEFGGIKWSSNQEVNSRDSSWGYGNAPRTKEEYLQRLEGQVARILELSDQVWGYCYTQLTDVEQEQNGIYYYDRSPKFDTETIYKIFSRNP